jgi:hypothetical protein
MTALELIFAHSYPYARRSLYGGAKINIKENFAA